MHANARRFLMAAALTVVGSGCAGVTPAPGELQRCQLPESLVCYGHEATRIENRERLEGVEFCRCERLERIDRIGF